MKQLRTLLSVISFIVCTITSAQDEPQKVSARDTLPPGEEYGLRVGLDISKIIRSFANEDYEGLEIVGDYRIYKDYYLAAEIGTESLLRNEENLSVEGKGNFLRIGVDYNAYDNWYGMQNSIYAGLRYGFSIFDQTLNNYRIFTQDNYFPTEIRNQGRNSEDLTAGWIELVLGLEVELFANIYMGASVSLRGLISEQNPDGFDNLFIPGYGRTNDFSEFAVGYNYSISYLIPFAKRRR